MPPMTHKFFKHLAIAVQSSDLSENEIQMLSKLCHFSVKSLKKLNLPIEKILKSPDDASSVLDFSYKFKEEENLNINLPLEEILKKGLDCYNSPEMYQIIMKLLREVYTPYIDFKKASDEKDQTKMNTISQKVDQSLKTYDIIFDFVSDKVLKMIHDLKNSGEKLMDAYKQSIKEETKEGDANQDALNIYKKGYYDLYSSYSDNSKILDYYRILLICYSS